MERIFWFVILIISCYGQDGRPSSFLPGDVTIVGLYEGNLADSGECGNVDIPSIMAMEATRWTIDQINKAQMVPLKIGFRGYRTCGNLHTAGDIANSIVYDAKTANSTSGKTIIGVLGPKYSSETEVVSRMLSNQLPENRILQLGFSATAVTLDDKQSFPNFFRVLPDDGLQVQTMIQLMIDLEWSRIAIIYENDTYGHAAATNLRREANKNHICIAQFAAISIDESRGVSSAQIKGILDTLVLAGIKIGATVFIGNRDTANKVLHVTDEQTFRDVPLFLMPEAVQLQMDVFRKPDEPIFTKARGTLLTSIPYGEVRGFKSHWLSLFADKQAAVNASISNPFLKEVFKAYTECDLDDVSCPAPSASDLNALNNFQPTYIRYVTMAAHVMVEALQKVYTNTCKESCNNVDVFLEKFNSSSMIDAIDGLEVSFPGDFVSGIDSVGPNMTLKFSSMSANPMYQATDVVYEAYNFVQLLNGTYSFVKIGETTTERLTLNKTKIIDFDENGDRQVYPNVRKGQCEVSKLCSDCIDKDISQAIYHIPGDVYVIGVCSINNMAIDGPQGCGTIRTRHGFQMVLAMKYGLESFLNSSKYRAHKEMFGDSKVGLLVLNSCNNAVEIDRKLLNLHSEGITLDDGSHLDLTDRVLGYIGGQAADVSEPTAVQLTRLGVVQISYSSTYPALSDRTLYPYFMRIVTPDNVQASVMMDVVLELGGKYIQLVYSQGKYGEGGRNNVVEAAKQKKICIAQIIEVKESTEYFEYFELMRRKSHAKLVIIFLRSHVVGTFMRNIDSLMEPGEFQFIGSEAWAKNAEMLQYGINKGSLTVALEMAKKDDLDEYIKSQTPSWGVTHPWLENYLQQRQDCYFPWSFNKQFSKECSESMLPVSDTNFESDPWCIFVTNTMISFLKGSAVFYNERCRTRSGTNLCQEYTGDPKGLMGTMKQVELDITGTGSKRIYDDQGDGSMGYIIFNIRTKGDSFMRDYVKVGSYDVTTGLTFNKDMVRFPTDDVIVSACPNEKACEACKEETVTIPTSEKKLDVALIVLGALLGTSAIVIVILLCLMFARRKPVEAIYITPTDRDPAEGRENFDDPDYSNMSNRT